ncbi:DUF1127 domain-containing protein [Dongia rigui]|uniref:DUF1127 domain-containing protein n=1 Tax=Dongia rigui TaxID=940149 RepID=A0ABU5DZK7_9PROT|nr:DUF1127 domain-containing protein [Dongia rigui]MDY0872360.1 DUF1127 domain-containing protein [Dongia rigui]
MTQISLFSGSAATSQRSTRLFSNTRLAAATSALGHLGALVIAFQEWQERHRTRRDLMRLSDHQLKDIGLSRFDAEEEFQKPFWQV